MKIRHKHGFRADKRAAAAEAATPAGLDPPQQARQLQEAIAHHRAGRLAEAEALYRQMLAANPTHLDALYLLGVIAVQTGNFAAALDFTDQALRINPGAAECHANRGNALRGLGQYPAALQSYDEAIRLKPEFAAAHSDRGNALCALQHYQAALESFDQALRLQPNDAETWNLRGHTLCALQRFNAALESFDRALLLNPNYAEAHNNRGHALSMLRYYPAALESLDHAIRLKPDFAEAHSNRGNALHGLRQHQAAVESYDEALRLKPGFAEAHSNRGSALYALHQFQAALESCDTALRLHSGFVAAHILRGTILYQLGQHAEAVASFDQALLLEPGSAAVWANRGAALHELKQHQAAVESCDRALELNPDCAEAHGNRGAALHSLQQYPAALASFDQALRLQPDIAYLAAMRLHMKRFLCDWEGLEELGRLLEADIERGAKAAFPFEVLAVSDSPALQRRAAEIYAGDHFPERPAPVRRSARRDKIRIGYFSADYFNHATSYLMAELFELHDRSRFEIVAFSFGPDVQDGMRARVSAAMDRFVDVRALSDQAAAALSRELEIDIAVDLKGYTKDNRAGIFAERAAPVQVSYLGYPGTMGAEFMDYLVADPTLIPEAIREYYTEKIAYLPDSYQVNDSRRLISSATPTRAGERLPEDAFVFCCFNINWKIAPATFDVWMRLLGRVEGSVLWLLEDNAWAAANLRREAERRGIAAERLIFAGRLPLAEHLARHRLADLFLDTLPYNAHTTASDALWTGLPVLTCMGRSFASRVGASLIHAIDLPEMITTNAADYEALALELARNPQRLRALREKLERHRLTTPLFDTPRFTRHLEAVYTAMIARYDEGLAPDHIHIR